MHASYKKMHAVKKAFLYGPNIHKFENYIWDFKWDN